MHHQGSKIVIKALTDSKRERRRFIQFQFDLYKQDPLWVPPLIRDELNSLDSQTNPGLEGCELRLWLAIRDGVTVGRIAGVINHRDNEIRDIKAARFCLLDFIDDVEVAQGLLDTVESWAIGYGMKLVEGPLGLTTFERSAVLIDGFDRLPTVVSSYNLPYYAGHIEACGFTKEIDYLEHRFQLPSELDPKYHKVAQYVLKKKGLHIIEKKSRRELRPLGRDIFQLINAAYSDLFEFTPMGDQEIDTLIKKFFSFIDPRFVKLVVNEHETIVAVGVAMPSYSELLQTLQGKLWRLPIAVLQNQLKGSSDTLDLYLVAVAPELRNAGLNAIIMQSMHQTAVATGLKWVETNGELETNKRVLAMWKDIDHETHKRRRIFSKILRSNRSGK